MLKNWQKYQIRSVPGFIKMTLNDFVLRLVNALNFCALFAFKEQTFLTCNEKLSIK